MTMQKPFAVDIDDVLGYLGQLLNASLNTMTGRAVSFDEWSHYRVFEFYGIGVEQFLNRIIDEQLLTTMTPCEGAQQALASIQQAGSDVVLITARGYHPQAEAVTLEWLDRHGMPFDDLIVVPEGQSKGEVAKRRYPKGFSVMIDDNDSNLDSMKSFGLVQQTILVDKPWNRSRDDYRHGINRFNGLHQFIENLKKGYVAQRAGGVMACEF
jgi:5'(3')-deoxyribonucleotidase